MGSTLEWGGSGSAYAKNAWNNGATKETIAPGDVLVIGGGVMDVPGGNLDGNPLIVGQGGFAPIEFTLNLSSGADVSLETTTQTNNPSVFTGPTVFTINVAGSDSLTIAPDPVQTVQQNAAPTFVTDAIVNLAAHSDLVMAATMNFGHLSMNGPKATLTLDGGSSFGNTQVFLDTNLAGSGEIQFGGHMSSSSHATIDGKVSSGVLVVNNGTEPGSPPAVLTIDKPLDFAGKLEMGAPDEDTVGDAITVLAGLNATSFALKGDILSFFDGNRLVKNLKFDNETFLGHNQQANSHGTMKNLTVEHNAFGVMIATTGNDLYQPGGVGAALTEHSAT